MDSFEVFYENLFHQSFSSESCFPNTESTPSCSRNKKNKRIYKSVHKHSQFHEGRDGVLVNAGVLWKFRNLLGVFSGCLLVLLGWCSIQTYSITVTSKVLACCGDSWWTTTSFINAMACATKPPIANSGERNTYWPMYPATCAGLWPYPKGFLP